MTHDEKRDVRRIVESGIETRNFELSQMYITELAEFDADLAQALQEILDEAIRDARP